MKLSSIYQPISSVLADTKSLLQQLAVNTLEEGRQGRFDISTRNAVKYLLDRQGKALRPALVFFSAGAVSETVATAALKPLAASVELIHSASLIHDDIIDDADRRRTILSVHKKFGTKSAVLIGDVLYSQAFQLLTTLPHVAAPVMVRLFQLLSDLTAKMCYGEIFEQQVITNTKKISSEDYLRILEYKTALLMSISCRCGGLIAGCSATDEQRLADFGMAIGMAYQLTDDYADNDSIYSGEMDLTKAAKEYIKSARTLLQSFAKNAFTEGLDNLASHILERAGDHV